MLLCNHYCERGVCNVEDRLSGWQRVFGFGGRRVVDTVPKARERAPGMGRKGGTATGRLLHREERPTLERNIIDTSERARANYRNLIGQHFRHSIYTNQFSEVATLCREFERLCIWQIFSMFRAKVTGMASVTRRYERPSAHGGGRKAGVR